MKNILPILVILYVKSRFVILSRGVQLDNGVDPPCAVHNLSAPRKRGIVESNEDCSCRVLGPTGRSQGAE